MCPDKKQTIRGVKGRESPWQRTSLAAGIAQLQCWILCLLSLSALARGDPQTFIESPSDRSITQGTTTILVCHVANLKGEFLWTKGGFSLGYGRNLEGYPRYSIVGNADIGENNLMISGVQLEDDDVFECQILPGGGDIGLRGSARLTVLVPPDPPFIEGYQEESVVKVPHQEETLSLTCVCNHGKPAPQLHWYRNGLPLEINRYTIVYNTTHLADKRENAKSVMTFDPIKEDNGANYQCEPEHPALTSPQSAMVQLSVMHPPNTPEITGYTNGQVINTNYTLKLVCVARGGNPLPMVHWFKNGRGIDYSYEFGGDKAENELIFLVEPSDNEAVYRCEASNVVTPDPLFAEVKLDVQFPPSTVTITGQEHAKAGETITLKCTTSISNPPAEISWLALGKIVEETTGSTEASPQGGYITTSEIEVTLTSNDDQVVYQCNANNNALGYVATSTISLQVVYPPGQPTISGYTEGVTVTAGHRQMMNCQSVGGNPPATLTWWKGDEQLESESTRNFNLVSSQLSFVLAPDDNGAEYRCNATNPATEEPLQEFVTLTVNFPPKSLLIEVTPSQGHVGELLTLTCTSASSNPASTVYWTNDAGDEIVNSRDTDVVNADYGGWSTISVLEIVPSVQDHGQIYACNAKNDLIQMAVSDATTLDILFSPVFPPGAPTQLDVVEFGDGSVNLTANANPSEDLVYTWFLRNQKIITASQEAVEARRKKRDINLDHFEQDGPVLYVRNASRGDTGNYVVMATNALGSTNHSIKINVQYEAEVIRISQNVLADEGSEARLECVVDANPVAAEHFNWTREDFNMSKTSGEFDGANSRSVLVIPQVAKEDSGLFVCAVNNGIGETSSSSAQLIVKYSPEIDKSPTYGKAAADKGATAKLICKAEGAPNVDFEWFIVKDTDIAIDVAGSQYSTESKKLGLVQYEAFLFVHNTTKEDYGQYKCVAKNSLGQDEHVISLDGTSKPDPPFDLQVVNTTHNSVTLSWKPGFDGGSIQRFQVRYVEVGQTEGHKYADVIPLSATIFTVTGLKLATEYVMDVRAINRLGESGYQDSPIIVKTAAWSASAGEGDEVPLIIILVVSIIGMILLGLNVLLILFFIRRRRKKMHYKSEASSTVNTIEMYHANTLTDDSKSFTTYDRRSFDEYQDEMYKPYDPDDDELRRFLGPAAYGPPDDLPPYKYYNQYPSISRNEYSPSPGISKGPMGHEPHYGSSPAMYPGPPPRPSHYDRDPDEDDYTLQLRKMQQGISGSGLPANPKSESLGHLPPLPMDAPYGDRPMPPPLPPTRSVSRGTLNTSSHQLAPPVPSRNYDDYGDRYTLPPGGPTYESVPSTTDVRGHLV